MEEVSSKSSLVGFAFYLSENNLVDKDIGLAALKEATTNKTSYIELLIKKKLLKSALIAKATSEYFGLPLCDISAFNSELIPKQLLNLPIIHKRLALPLFSKNGILYLAVTDPSLENLSDVQFFTGLNIRLLIADSAKLKQVIDGLLNTLIFSEMKSNEAESRDVSVNPYREEEAEFVSYDAQSAPVVNYVNKIIIDAIDKGVSDIHFERYANEYRIRYRL